MAVIRAARRGLARAKLHVAGRVGLLRVGRRARAALLLEAEPVVGDGVHGDLPHEREREEAAGDEARHDLPHDGHRRGERDAHFRLQGLVERGYDRYDRVRDLDARRELRREGGGEAALQLVLQDRGADGDAPRLARAV